MPTYPLINLKTKEKKELSMTMAAYDEWRNDPENVDWDKDWLAGVAGIGEVGEVYSATIPPVALSPLGAPLREMEAAPPPNPINPCKGFSFLKGPNITHSSLLLRWC